MAKHNFNPDRLRPPDVMQLMYMFGFNPTATAMGAPTCRFVAARQCVLRLSFVTLMFLRATMNPSLPSAHCLV
jgi:hypothetical protein